MARRLVATRALVARINRRLSPCGERIHKSRRPLVPYLGRFYAVDAKGTVFRHIRLEWIARTWGALQTRERWDGE